MGEVDTGGMRKKWNGCRKNGWRIGDKDEEREQMKKSKFIVLVERKFNGCGIERPEDEGERENKKEMYWLRNRKTRSRRKKSKYRMKIEKE